MAPAGRPSLTAADLERLPLILYEIGANTRAIIDAWFRRAGLRLHLEIVESPDELCLGRSALFELQP